MAWFTHRSKLHSHQVEAFLFESLNNFPNQTSLNPVRLYHNETPFISALDGTGTCHISLQNLRPFYWKTSCSGWCDFPYSLSFSHWKLGFFFSTSWLRFYSLVSWNYQSKQNHIQTLIMMILSLNYSRSRMPHSLRQSQVSDCDW